MIVIIVVIVRFACSMLMYISLIENYDGLRLTKTVILKNKQVVGEFVQIGTKCSNEIKYNGRKGCKIPQSITAKTSEFRMQRFVRLFKN